MNDPYAHVVLYQLSNYCFNIWMILDNNRTAFVYHDYVDNAVMSFNEV